MSDLRAYVVASKRFGPQGLYEEALRSKLPPLQLGYLVEHLRGLGWRPTIEQRHDLIDRLLDDDVASGRVQRMVGCSKQTVWRRGQLRAGGARTGVGSPLTAWGQGSKTGTPNGDVGNGQVPAPGPLVSRLEHLDRESRQCGYTSAMAREARSLSERIGCEPPRWARRAAA